MPFATIWLDLEGTILHEFKQNKTDTIQSHLHVEYKTTTIKPKITDKQVVARGKELEVGKMAEGGQSKATSFKF